MTTDGSMGDCSASATSVVEDPSDDKKKKVISVCVLVAVAGF